LVLSPNNYNAKIGLVLVCPITSKVKNLSFETKIPENIHVKGVVLSDQIKSFDWKIRNIDYICTMPPSTVNEVIDKMNTL
jgi:mRNA interferase MazF